MPRVSFTANLNRHVDCPTSEVAGETVREALDGLFAQHPQLKGYVCDEHGRLRKHMVVFIDGQPVKDRETLGDSITEASEIYVMQALSGG